MVQHIVPSLQRVYIIISRHRDCLLCTINTEDTGSAKQPCHVHGSHKLSGVFRKSGMSEVTNMIDGALCYRSLSTVEPFFR